VTRCAGRGGTTWTCSGPDATPTALMAALTGRGAGGCGTPGMRGRTARGAGLVARNEDLSAVWRYRKARGIHGGRQPARARDGAKSAAVVYNF